MLYDVVYTCFINCIFRCIAAEDSIASSRLTSATSASSSLIAARSVGTVNPASANSDAEMPTFSSRNLSKLRSSCAASPAAKTSAMCQYCGALRLIRLVQSVSPHHLTCRVFRVAAVHVAELAVDATRALEVVLAL